jgi:hypothetical protein
VLNNPDVRLSGQPLQVDLSCTVSGLGYVGAPIAGTVSVSSIPQNLAPPCTPYNCGGFLQMPDTPPGHCLPSEELPSVIYLTDVDGNGCVEEADLLRVLMAMGTRLEETPDPAADVNWDGVIDEEDLLMVLFDLGNCDMP